MDRVVKFLKIYLVFIAYVLTVNIFLELVISPENHKIIAEHGWDYFLKNVFFGITVFYVIFNSVGTIIFIKKRYDPKRMGVLSLIIALILEFTVMRPEWVQNVYKFTISGETFGAIVVTSIFWFATWSVPSYLARKLVNE